MRKKAGATTTTYLAICFVILSLFVLLGNDRCPPPPPHQKQFSLAYIDTSWHLRLRWSKDGVNWDPAEGATPLADRAPGLASDTTATIYLAPFVNSTSDATMLTGLGPAIWDTSPRTIGNGHRGEVQSATSMTHVASGPWLVAYEQAGRARVWTYDDSNTVKDFVAEVTPVSGVAANSGLTDRPAIVNRNGRVVAAWLMTNQLQVVTGNIQGGIPVWEPGYLFNANVAEQGFGSPLGAFALTDDGQNFYVAVVRQRDPLPGEEITHYFLFLYSSPNGLNWTKLATHEARNPTAMSAAARSSSDVIVILSSPATALSYANCYRFNGTDWTVLDRDKVFGDRAMNRGHDFSLYAK